VIGCFEQYIIIGHSNLQGLIDLLVILNLLYVYDLCLGSILKHFLDLAAPPATTTMIIKSSSLIMLVLLVVQFLVLVTHFHEKVWVDDRIRKLQVLFQR
jgi:hypothetical protein